MTKHLVDMSRKLGDDIPEAKSPSEDHFPLSLFLDTEQIEKLGLETADIGQNYVLTADVKVTHISASEGEFTKRHQDVTLTIKRAAVERDVDDRTVAQRLFQRD